MKNIILLLTIIVITNVVAQEKTTIQKFEIGKSATKVSLNNGNYSINFYKEYNDTIVRYSPPRTSITTIPIDQISVDEVFSVQAQGILREPNIKEYEFLYSFNIEPRTKVVVEIDEISLKDKKTEVDGQIIVEKIDGDIKTHTYTFTGIQEKKWVTSFGLAGAYLLETQTYKTIAENGAFRIVPDGNQKLIEAIPVVQFSYLNIKKDNGFAWTGGLGFDTENLSAFAGGSYYVGHNLLLTAGFALHKQRRRTNKYANEQIVPEALEFDVLNEQYYRVNPFISLTFVMNRNFLKK